ncbi:fibronectin-binding protein [Mycobacterium sp.]|uniref:fibronectin-binding protein n=1 Tax=Mycobacterium sp. TaxID=1785 RepID=UPI003F955A33
MPVLKAAAIILLGTMTTGLCPAAPAGADPGFDPCHSGVPFACSVFPMMPDLDHDVDLTQDPDALTGGPGPTNQPGADLGGR